MVRRQEVLEGGLVAATSGSPPACFPANCRKLNNFELWCQITDENSTGQGPATDVAMEPCGQEEEGLDACVGGM